ncbi:MAG: TlpA disulfide reductase family protein [Alistipes sp.]|nr:TlpA disulfide reductase family protein [Alistipes sp.]
MKRLFYFATIIALAVAVTSCSKSAVKSVVRGRFVTDRVDSIFLERISDDYDAVTRVGATRLSDDGSFEFKFAMDNATTPSLYRLSFDSNVRPITLVIAQGDDIYIDSVGDLFLNYEVQNSEESKLIEQFNKEYYASVDRLANLSEQIARGGNNVVQLNMQAYIAAKDAMQAQVRFVGSHQQSLAAFYASRQHVVEEYVPMLEGKGISTPHLQALKLGLEERYPESPYIKLLESEIEDAQVLALLAENVTETAYPNIVLDDMYKEKHSLSDLDGNVILLYFWSAELPLCNNINAELKELYEKYHEDGFEVYHVSVDGSRALWIEAVRAQQLPWTSLFGGNDPQLFTLYNIVELPMAYIISRDGTIDTCSLDPKTLESEIKSRI